MDTLMGELAIGAGLLLLALQGIVKLLDSAFDRNWRAVAKIAVSAISGAFLAPYASFVYDTSKINSPLWFLGMLVGFGAAGVITLVSYNGAKSAVQVDTANIVKSENVEVAKKSKK